MPTTTSTRTRKKRGRSGPPTMTGEHKAALAAGREQSRAVRSYLDALEADRPRRGRTRSRQTVERRLAEIHETIDSASPLNRLHMIQERIDLAAELERMDAATPDISGLEEAFVAHAGTYAARRGISFMAWRSLGVPARLLLRAGITRST